MSAALTSVRRSNTNFVGLALALFTVALGSVLALFPPCVDIMRQIGLLGWGASPGPALLIAIACVAAWNLLQKRDLRRLAIVAACLIAPVVADTIELVSALVPEAVQCVAVATLMSLLAITVGRMRSTPLAVKVGFCSIAAAVLALFIFNAYSPYEEMHFFGGGAVV